MNYNTHDGEKKAQPEAEADDCACITCGFRRVLQAKYPDGLNDENRAEIRASLARIVASITLEDTPEEARAFELQVRRAKSTLSFAMMMDSMFGGSVIMVSIG